MRQSEKVLSEYHKRENELSQGIADLKREIQQERKQLDDNKQKYESYVVEGEDDKADKLMDDIETLETSIKRKSKRLETKQRLEKKANLDNVAGTLDHVPHIKDEFADEIKENDDTISKLFDELETALDERKALSEEFKDIYEQFIDIRDANKPDNDEDLKEFIDLVKPTRIGHTAPALVSDAPLLRNQIKAFKKEIGGNK